MTRDSGDLTLLIHRSMVSAGWDVDTLYARLGYDVRELPLYDSRPRHSLQQGFWHAVEEMTGDPQTGLSLCPYIQKGTLASPLMVEATAVFLPTEPKAFTRETMLCQSECPNGV